MKVFVSLLLVAALVVIITDARRVPRPPKRPDQSPPNRPSRPGKPKKPNPGPFRPRPYHPRLRRSLEENAPISVNGIKENRKISSLGGIHTIGGASKLIDYNPSRRCCRRNPCRNNTELHIGVLHVHKNLDYLS